MELGPEVAQRLWESLHRTFKELPSPPHRVDCRFFLKVLLSVYLKDRQLTETLFGLGLAAAQMRGGLPSGKYANSSEQIADLYISRGVYSGEQYREDDDFPGKQDRIFTVNPSHKFSVWKEKEQEEQSSPDSWTYYTDDFVSEKGLPPFLPSSGSGWCLKLSRVEGEWQTEFYAPHHSNKTYIVYRHGLRDISEMHALCRNFLRGSLVLEKPIKIPLLIDRFGDNPSPLPFDISYLQNFLVLNKSLCASCHEWRHVQLARALAPMFRCKPEFAETMHDFNYPGEHLVVSPDHQGYRVEQREDSTKKFELGESEARKVEIDPPSFAKFTLLRLLGEPGTEVQGSSGLLYQVIIRQVRIFLSLADSNEKLAQQISSLMSKAPKSRPSENAKEDKGMGETSLIRGKSVFITIFLDTGEVPGAIPLNQLCDLDFYKREDDGDSIISKWDAANRELEARMVLPDLTKEAMGSRFSETELQSFLSGLLFTEQDVARDAPISKQILVERVYKRRQEIKEHAERIRKEEVALSRSTGPRCIKGLTRRDMQLLSLIRPWNSILRAARIPAVIEKVREIPQAPSWAGWKNLKIYLRETGNSYCIKVSYVGQQPNQEVNSAWVDMKGLKGLWRGKGSTQVFQELKALGALPKRTSRLSGKGKRQRVDATKRKRMQDLGQRLAELTGLTYPRGGLVKALGSDIGSFVTLVSGESGDKAKFVQYDDSRAVDGKDLGSGGATSSRLDDNGINETAIAEIRTKAEQGDAEAQYCLAKMFEKGTGVQKDPTKAVEWYQKASNQGYPKALYQLGLLYFHGKWVKPDEVKGESLIKRAAELGCSEADQWIRDLPTEQS